MNPLFSVVIPTRNRAHLLKDAIQSVIGQDFDDYELIVSDNDSADGTRELVAGLPDCRVRYVRPASYLFVHDHWNFAIQHARGRYVLLLADDDCLVSHALSTFAQLIEATASLIIGCKSADYFSADYPVESQRNTIRLQRFSGELIRLDTRFVLSKWFQFNPSYYPMVTIPISKALIDEITRKVGYFFARPFPEYVAYAMAYASVSHYFLLDRPLVVLGRTPDSLGPRAYWLNQDLTWKEIGDTFFENVPLSGTYATNGIAESVLRAKRNLPEQFRGIELSHLAYYYNYYSDMITQRRLGRDIQSDMHEYYLQLEALPAELRKQVYSAISSLDSLQPWHSVIKHRYLFWYKLSQRAKHTRFGVRIKTVKSRIFKTERRQNDVVPTSPEPTPEMRIIAGEQLGVSDILSCATWLANRENPLDTPTLTSQNRKSA